jgi:hypothetical protein
MVGKNLKFFATKEREMLLPSSLSFHDGTFSSSVGISSAETFGVSLAHQDCFQYTEQGRSAVQHWCF